MSRHPYTYASDFVRSLAGYNLDGAILSRSEASKILEGIAPILGLSHEELAVKLSEYYQEHEEEISQKSADEFLRVTSAF